VLGLQTALLGRGEALGGDLELGQIEQRLVNPLQPLLQSRAQRAHGRRGDALWADAGQGIGEQGWRLAGRSHAQSRHQDAGLARAQAVDFSRTLGLFLLLGLQAAKFVGQRRPDLPAVQLGLQGRGEPTSEGETARDPGGAPSDPPPHRALSEIVLAHQGLDHARFVHGGEAAGRSIGAQEQQLAVHGRSGLLDHGRDLGRARAEPLSQALEAIDDLERSVVERYRPHRHLGEHGGGLRGRPGRGAQAGQPRVQPFHGQPLHVGRRGRFARHRCGLLRRGDGG